MDRSDCSFYLVGGWCLLVCWEKNCGKKQTFQLEFNKTCRLKRADVEKEGEWENEEGQ